MDVVVSNGTSDSKILELLNSDNRAEIYHHPAWLRAISEATNSIGHYLLVEHDKRLVGLIPFIIKDNFFNSLPFTTHCSPILTEEINLITISTKIQELFPDIYGFRFQFRDEKSSECKYCRTNYLNHVIFLNDDIDEYYNSLGRRSIRRFIRKSYENGLKLRFGNTDEDLRIFYHLECKLRKSIGLPPAPFYFFNSIWKNLLKQNLILLPIVEYKSIPIASSLVLLFKDILYFEYTAIDKKFINLFPNHFLHWEIINHAHSEYKIRKVDLGRTNRNQDGLIFFKENWNAKGINLVEFSNLKHKNLKSSRWFETFKRINKHLPLSVLKLEGQLLFNKFEKQ